MVHFKSSSNFCLLTGIKKCLFIYTLPHLKPMTTHFSGKSARSFPQNPMQRPTVLTVSQPDSKSFPLGSVLCVVHDWKESPGGFSSVISFSCISCSPSIFRQLFLSSSVLVLLSFSCLFPIHGLHPAISLFLHAFRSSPTPSYLSSFSSAPLFASCSSALLPATDY